MGDAVDLKRSYKRSIYLFYSTGAHGILNNYRIKELRIILNKIVSTMFKRIIDVTCIKFT